MTLTDHRWEHRQTIVRRRPNLSFPIATPSFQREADPAATNDAPALRYKAHIFGRLWTATTHLGLTYTPLHLPSAHERLFLKPTYQRHGFLKE